MLLEMVPMIPCMGRRIGIVVAALDGGIMGIMLFQKRSRKGTLANSINLQVSP